MSVNQFRIQRRASWAVIVGLLAASTSAHASPILSVRGEIEGLASFLGNSYDQVLAQEWTTTEKYEDVSIAVSVGSLFPSFRTGTAFLTSNIGPGATTGDLIASDVFEVPLTSAYNTQVSDTTIFSGLTLNQGTYFLVLSAPLSSSGNHLYWNDNGLVTTTAAPGVTYVPGVFFAYFGYPSPSPHYS
jgi:hypothetical protein